MATASALAQSALNIALPIQTSLRTGAAPSNADVLHDLCACVILLSEAVINSGGGTVSVAPTYSAAVSTTANVQTKGR